MASEVRRTRKPMPPSLNIILLNVQENPHLHILELLLYMSNSMLTHQFPPTQALSSFFTVIAYTQIITLKLMFFPPPFFVCFSKGITTASLQGNTVSIGKNLITTIKVLSLKLKFFEGKHTIFINKCRIHQMP